jgi:hypothetical protein
MRRGSEKLDKVNAKEGEAIDERENNEERVNVNVRQGFSR